MKEFKALRMPSDERELQKRISTLKSWLVPPDGSPEPTDEWQSFAGLKSLHSKAVQQLIEASDRSAAIKADADSYVYTITMLELYHAGIKPCHHLSLC
jgi:hypothetical protein